MQQTSAAFLKVLAGSPVFDSRVDILAQGTVVENDVPVVSWQVEADSSRWVRRTCNVVLPSGVSLLPFGQELRVRSGPLVGGAPELVCLGTFGVYDVKHQYPVGPVQVQGMDRSQRLTDDRFPTARSFGDSTVLGGIGTLVRESVPWAGFGAFGVADAVLGQTSWDRDRDGALKQLAASLGAELFAEPWGDFVARPIPDPDGTTVWSLAKGDGMGLQAGTVTISRNGVYNAVSAYSSGQTAVSGYAEDNDPYSPTYVGGPFGRVIRFLASPFLVTADQAAVAAAAFLRKVTALQRSIEFQCIANYALEPGDCISVDFGDGPERHLVQRCSWSSSANTMSVTTLSGSPSDEA